jgi:hypothetical protein
MLVNVSISESLVEFRQSIFVMRLVQCNRSIRGWPHDSICKLCTESIQSQYNTSLSTLECHFSTAVWEQIFACNRHLRVPPVASQMSLNEWWDETISKIPKNRRREASGAIIYLVCYPQKKKSTWCVRVCVLGSQLCP